MVKKLDMIKLWDWKSNLAITILKKMIGIKSLYSVVALALVVVAIKIDKTDPKVKPIG